MPSYQSRMLLQGLESVPVPPFATDLPFTASMNLKPEVVTVIVHEEDTLVPSESTTVMVGVAPLWAVWGLAQLISPVLLFMVMPDGALESENVYGYKPPMTPARMLYSIPG
ncbi:MAG: hypothetical protein HS130_02295 [Deltaproteobacteria bacterium]|nr:hypothetical protein [Deltaproteobacteria bacterium]